MYSTPMSCSRPIRDGQSCLRESSSFDAASPRRRHGPSGRRQDGAVSKSETSWGIDPVPERLRVLGGFDLALLWGNLGVSLLVVVAGAILVPAL